MNYLGSKGTKQEQGFQNFGAKAGKWVHDRMYLTYLLAVFLYKIFSYCFEKIGEGENSFNILGYISVPLIWVLGFSFLLALGFFGVYWKYVRPIKVEEQQKKEDILVKLNSKIQEEEAQKNPLSYDQAKTVSIIEALARILDLYSNTYVRISLYYCIDEIDLLHRVARFSANPDLDSVASSMGIVKPFPRKEGFIGRALSTGKDVQVTDLPDPEKNEDDYLKRIREYQEISDDTLDNVRIKSRAYFVRPFQNTKTGKYDAAIIIESTKSTELNIPDITAKLNKNAELIRTFVESYSKTRKGIFENLGQQM